MALYVGLDAHHVSDTASVAAVGFVGPCGEETLCVPGLDAHRFEATFK
jgi:hypothetical protein